MSGQPNEKPCPYPYGHKNCCRSYACYYKAMKAYGFVPLDMDTWQAWQAYRKKSH